MFPAILRSPRDCVPRVLWVTANSVALWGNTARRPPRGLHRLPGHAGPLHRQRHHAPRRSHPEPGGSDGNSRLPGVTRWPGISPMRHPISESVGNIPGPRYPLRLLPWLVYIIFCFYSTSLYYSQLYCTILHRCENAYRITRL